MTTRTQRSVTLDDVFKHRDGLELFASHLVKVRSSLFTSMYESIMFPVRQEYSVENLLFLVEGMYSPLHPLITVRSLPSRCTFICHC